MKKYILTLLLLQFYTLAFPQVQQFGNKISPIPINANSYYGTSVCISENGDIAFVAGPYDNSYLGNVYVYSFNGFNYNIISNLSPVSVTGHVYFGSSICTSRNGNILAIGAPGIDNNSGGFYIYSISGIGYSLISKITPPVTTPNISFGSSLACSADGKTIIVGAPRDVFDPNSSDSYGSLWVYTFNGIGYEKFKNNLTVTGGVNEIFFGQSLSVSSDAKTIVCSGYGDNLRKGALWVLSFDGQNYIQIGNKISINSLNYNAHFGFDVNVSGDGKKIVIGSLYDDGSGAGYVFSFDGYSFQQMGVKLTPDVGYSNFGRKTSISNDGNLVSFSEVNSSNGKGRINVYTFSGANYEKINSLLPIEELNDNSNFGQSYMISKDGKFLISGAPGENYQNGAFWIFRERLPQSITGFDLPDYKIFGDSPFPLSSESTSGLIPSYISSGIGGTIVDNNLYFIGTGVITVTAFQSGDLFFKPAQNEIRIISVLGFSQAVSNIVSSTTGVSNSAELNALVASIVGQNIANMTATGYYTLSPEQLQQIINAATAQALSSLSGVNTATGATITVTSGLSEEQVNALVQQALANALGTLTGMNISEASLSLSIYPVPSPDGVFYLSGLDNPVQIQVFNSMGNAVLHTFENYTLSLHNAKNGVYQVIISSRDKLERKKVVVHK